MRRVAIVLWSVAACGGDPDTLAPDGTPGMPIAAVAASAALTSTCGVAAAPKLIAVKNTGTADLAITSAIADGGFTVAAMADSIQPGMTGTIGVLSPAAVIGTDRPGDAKTGTLTIETNAGTHVVALTSSVAGAEIRIVDQTGMPAAPSFTSTNGTCPAQQVFTIENTGTLPATVMITSVANVSVGSFSGGMLAAGGTATLAMTPLTTECVITGHVAYAVTGPVCSMTPVTLPIEIDITGASTCACSE